MKRTIQALAVAAATSSLAAPAIAETYAIDITHSSIIFSVNHLGYADVFGRFNAFEGTVEFDPEAPLDGSINLVIDASSVDTNHAPRDEHLRAPDFLNVGEFPEITFASTSLEQTGENTATMVGDLTMLGTTAPVEFEVTLNQVAANPMSGVQTAGFSARGSIDRTDFGVNFGAGGIGTEMDMMIEIEAVAQ